MPAALPAASAPTPAARPENIPEQFWDTEKGSLKSEDLLAAYSPLAEKAKAEEERLAAYPKAAADIPLDIPAGALGDGVKVELDPNNPLIGPARDLIFQKKLDPALLGELAGIVVKQQLAENAHFETRKAEENQKLGPNYVARIDAVDRGIAALVGPEHAKALALGRFTAKQVEAFEAVLNAVTSQGTQPRPVNPRESQNPNPNGISDEAYDKLSPKEKLEYARNSKTN